MYDIFDHNIFVWIAVTPVSIPEPRDQIAMESIKLARSFPEWRYCRCMATTPTNALRADVIKSIRPCGVIR